MFKIEFTKLVEKQLVRIYKSDEKLYQRIINAIEELKENPYLGKKLKGIYQGDYFLRVGQYRIIYTLYKSKLVITIIDIGHRRDVYRAVL